MSTLKATTLQNESASSGITLATDGKVGIDKTSPAVALDVTGAITATGAVTANSFSGDGSALTGLDMSHGTWTPTPVNNGNIGVTVNKAGYLRFGSFVRIWFDFTMDAASDGSAGHAKFSGLPFNIGNDSGYGGNQATHFMCPAVGYADSRYWGPASTTEIGMFVVSSRSTQAWSGFDGTARTMMVDGFYYTTDS